jgi:hypothetical protein
MGESFHANSLQIDLREKHAREIRAREEWFKMTLTSIGDAVIATDTGGAVTFLNPVAETLTMDRVFRRNTDRTCSNLFSRQSEMWAPVSACGSQRKSERIPRMVSDADRKAKSLLDFGG